MLSLHWVSLNHWNTLEKNGLEKICFKNVLYAFTCSDFFAFKIWEVEMRLRNDRQLGGLEMTGWLGYV